MIRPVRFSALLDRLQQLESPLSAREASVACLAVLLTVMGGAGLRLATNPASDQLQTWKVGGDFVAFYIGGRILNEHNESRLYDRDLQQRHFLELMPGETWLRAPYLYPPFIALLFRPLAAMPKTSALLVFLILITLVFAVGLWRLVSWFFAAAPRDHKILAFLAGMAFQPFLVYTWLGAQISVIGFIAIAFALVEEDRGRFFRCGLYLSLCSYKPTLLVLILPMLIFTRRKRQFAGFACGAAVAACISLAIAGLAGITGFLETMTWMSRSSLNTVVFNQLMYVDLNSFFRLLSPGTLVGYLARAGTTLCLIGLLVTVWRRAKEGDRHSTLLVWAATLTLGLVINIYTPYYDCVLLVVAAIVASAAIRSQYGELRYKGFGLMLVLLWISPWFAQILARSTRLQIYTLVLAAFGIQLVHISRKVSLAQSSRADAELRVAE